MNKRVVGALLVREGSYAVQMQLTYQLLPGARLQPTACLQGDILNPVHLMMDTIILSATGRIAPGVQLFHAEEA